MNKFQDYLQRKFDICDQGNYSVIPGAAENLTTLLDRTIVTPLYQYGFLAVDGPDANKFLQGQTTCDFRQVGPQQATRGAYCTPKGRMLSSFTAAALDDTRYRLRMRGGLVERSREALARYIVFSKAEMRDDSESMVALGIYGDEATKLLTDTVGNTPGGALQSLALGESLLLQLDEDGRCFEYWLPATEACELWPQLSKGALPTGSAFWDWLNIRSGHGEVCAQTSEQFLPQMLNYHLTGAVNFKKGCYTGQEVVARMHYRGKLKKHMYRAALAADAAPAPGTPLYADDSTQSIGDVVNAVQVAPGHCEMLAVMTVEAAAGGEVHPADSKVSLELLELPYTLEA